MSRYVVCITGASGVIYGIRLVEELLRSGEEVSLVVSEPGWRVMAQEVDFPKPRQNVEVAVRERFGLGEDDARLYYYENDDLFAPFCSGSYKTKGVVVIPAALATVGALANGVSIHLIERAADVALKEGRRLVVVPRETPLSLIHLENLANLARAGAAIVPAMPGYYTEPKTLEDAIDFVVGKVLDVLGIEHDLFDRWAET